MSGAARIGRLKISFPKVGSLAPLSGAGRAGPRRLVVISVMGLVVVGLVVAVATGGHRAPPFSQDARMKSVDPLPGGLHGTPEQSALARVADTNHAELAMANGISYTPQMGPSVPVIGAPPEVQQAGPRSDPPLQPHFVTRPPPPPSSIVPVATRIAFPPQPATGPTPVPQARPVQVAAAGDPQQQADYSKQIGDLFSQWGSRAPETTVILPPKDQNPSGDAADSPAQASSSAQPTTARATSVSETVHAPAKVLIPAGRGVYAHPMLALSSDQTSPVVLQADSGPIAGDRLIGSFARENDRLILHVNTIIHDNQNISCDGVVIAPDTMEASVATDVDEHYLMRFILPAAAAFIQGLGQALATTSNTTAVLSPLGGATTSTNLNFHQQLGVAAGVAAGQIGATLNQEAPKGPTVRLDANVAVGVMFLSNVTEPRSD